MASRYPLVVNTAIPRLEELKGVDDLNLSQNKIELSNGLPTTANQVIRYNGTELEWISSNTLATNVTQGGGIAFRTSTQILTNKTISGASNTLTDIPNSALVNDFITFGTQQVFLGDTIDAANTDTRYEINALSPGANTVRLKLDPYDIDNNIVTNPTPNGNTLITLTTAVGSDLTLTYNTVTKTITLDSTFVDTNTTYGVVANSGISLSGTSFLLKNYTAWTDQAILRWDDANGQFINSALTQSGTTINVAGSLSATGTLTSTNTTQVGNGSGSIGPKTLQLRGGLNITRGNSIIRAALVTDGTGIVTTFTDLYYDSATGAQGNASSWKILNEGAGVGNAVLNITPSQGTAPASATAAGRPGEIRFTATDIYICHAENSWIRAARVAF